MLWASWRSASAFDKKPYNQRKKGPAVCDKQCGVGAQEAIPLKPVKARLEMQEGSLRRVVQLPLPKRIIKTGCSKRHLGLDSSLITGSEDETRAGEDCPPRSYNHSDSPVMTLIKTSSTYLHKCCNDE